MAMIIDKLRKPTRTERAQIAVSLLTVTPDMAAELLELNVRNRSLNRQRVAEYEQMMRRNKWQPAQADICIDRDGHLINGQHFLSAVVASGREIVATLKTGMPPQAMDSIDSHRMRKVSDQLQIEGFSNATTVAGSVVTVMRWRQDGTTPSITGGGSAAKGGADRLQLLDYCRKHRVELENSAALAKARNRKTKLLPPSLLCSVQIVFADYAPRHAAAWCAELFEETDVSSQPVVAFRQKLIALKGTNNEWSASLKLAFAIKSFNAFMARRELKMFRLRPNETVQIDVPEGVN